MLLGLAVCAGSAALAGEAAPAAGAAQPAPCRLFEVDASCKPATHFASGAPTACREIARRRAERRPLGDRLEATAAVLERHRAATCAAHAAARTAAAGVPAWARGATEEDKARIAGETGGLTALQYMRDGY